MAKELLELFLGLKELVSPLFAFPKNTASVKVNRKSYIIYVALAHC